MISNEMLGLWLTHEPNLKAYGAGLEAATRAHSEGSNASDFEVVTLQSKLANSHYSDIIPEPRYHHPGIDTGFIVQNRNRTQTVAEASCPSPCGNSKWYKFSFRQHSNPN